MFFVVFFFFLFFFFFFFVYLFIYLFFKSNNILFIIFRTFEAKFDQINDKNKKNQFLIYFYLVLYQITAMGLLWLDFHFCGLHKNGELPENVFKQHSNFKVPRMGSKITKEIKT